MSIVAFTFGSFGDIFSLVGLAISIAKALSDSRGSSADCRELIDYLNAFVRHLYCSDDILSPFYADNGSSSDRSQPRLNRLAVIAIGSAIATCERLMTGFQTKFDPYQQSLVHGGSRRLGVDIWRKIRWMSFQTEVNDLRRKIDEQRDVIAMMLSLCNLTLTAESQKAPARLHTPSQVLGIYLTDLLDEKVFVPIQHCGSQIEFHQYLKFFFRNRAGRTFVDRGNYDLTAQSTNQLVIHQSWAESVKPGMALVMSALVKVSKSDRGVCPKCKILNDAASIEDELNEIQCSYCRTIFRVFDDRFEEVEDESAQVTGLTTGANSSAQSKAGADRSPHRRTTEDEAQYVRRISVIPLVLVHSPPQAAISQNPYENLNYRKHYGHMSPKTMAALPRFSDGLRRSSAGDLRPVLPFVLDDDDLLVESPEEEGSGYPFGEDNSVDEVEYAYG
ncbi:hypothetical protein PHLCEN_2v5455 [Hermanssonia centrifuga]|uniref:Ubiquitin-like domain-containing protein n=1 Tax=Hermanssonia centrifuga TaxID=98765 RepID=A0A2R6P2E3_9APHY|nr:hypothetical protein PHLCEN_2v5455 [Hermanssonia centrifuga]